MKAFLAKNSTNVGAAPGSTNTTVQAAMQSHMMLSDRLEKDVLEQEFDTRDGGHSVGASANDRESKHFSIHFKDEP